MPEISTTINTDFIVEEYGRIYQQRGQGLDRIKRALIQKAETLERFATHKRITDDIYEMANDEFQPVIQPFRVPFEPKGGVKFHPNKINLQHIKVDLHFSPDQIIDSWLGFLEGEGVKREQWPITRYMIEVYLKQQIDYDREINAVYYGVRDDAGTSPSSCMDGIRKKLIDGAASSYPINVISGIGALEESSVLDQVEAFSKSFKPIYQNAPIIICVSQEFKRAFLENKRSAGFYWLNGPQDINSNVDFTKHVVMGLPSMAGSKDMFAYVQGNLLWITRKYKFAFDVQKEDRYVKILGDWREGIGFGVNKMVWATAETVGNDSAADTASPEDGIVVRTTNPIITGAVPCDTTIDLTGVINGELPEGATIQFAYGTTTSLGSTASATKVGSNYTAQLTGLIRNTNYHVQLQVVAGTDTYKSAKLKVKTLTTAPTVTALAMSSIAATGATAKLTYSDPSSLVTGGGVEVTTSLSSDPTNTDGTPSAGTMAVNLTDLTTATSYYVRAYVKVGTEKIYTSWQTFTTA